MLNIKEGDFVMGQTTEGVIHGRVEHVMSEGGVYGVPGTEYSIQSTPENPAMAVRVFEETELGWQPTAYSIGMLYSDASLINIKDHSMKSDTPMDVAYNATVTDPTPANPSSSINPATGMKKPQYMMNFGRQVGSGIKDKRVVDIWTVKSDCTTKADPCWDGYVQRGMKPGDNGSMVPNCVPAEKADAPLPENPIMPTQTYEGCECDTCAANNTSCAACPDCGGMDAEREMAAYDASLGKSDEVPVEPTPEVKQPESFFNFRDMRATRNTVRLGE